MSYHDNTTFAITLIALQNGHLDVTYFIPAGGNVPILQGIEPISCETLNTELADRLRTVNEQAKRIFDPENYQVVDSVPEPEQNAEPTTEWRYHDFGCVPLDERKAEITYFVPHGTHIPVLDGLNPTSQTKLHTSKGGTMHRAVYSLEDIQEIKNRLDSSDEAGRIKKEREVWKQCRERLMGRYPDLNPALKEPQSSGPWAMLGWLWSFLTG